MRVANMHVVAGYPRVEAVKLVEIILPWMIPLASRADKEIRSHMSCGLSGMNFDPRHLLEDLGVRVASERTKTQRQRLFKKPEQIEA